MPQSALIVDDDLATCNLIQSILQSAGMDAMISTNSAQAVELLQRQKFDAVFLDVNMPHPDGIEVTRLTRASAFNQKTPIIIVSGEENTSVLSRGFQAGASFFLYKPINKERLLHLTRATHSTVQGEKRRHQRVVVARNVQVLFGQDVLKGETIDVSLRGVLVRAKNIFPTGSYVTVRIFIAHDQPPVTAEGTVVRVNGSDMGICLEHIGRDAAKRLQEFLLPLILLEPDANVNRNA